MRRQRGHGLGSFAPALRGLLTAFLMVAYIVVGIGGEISCAKEMLGSAGQIEFGDTSTNEDPGSKKSVALVDHCYTCVPLLLPQPILVVEPAAEPATLAFGTPTLLFEDHPGMDTPPPKHLT